MRTRYPLLGAGAAFLAGCAAAYAQSGGHGVAPGPAETVSVGFATFAPERVDVITGDTVTWKVDGARVHTVTAEDGSWSSEQMVAGDRYQRTFPATGTSAYFCRLHPTMRGAVTAHAVVLTSPRVPATPGRPYPLTGRAAAPAGTEVAIEADEGSGFVRVAAATVQAGGRFSGEVTPDTSATYRAVSEGGTSPPVDLIVLDRRVEASAVREGSRAIVAARVMPAAPGATAVLQLRLPERFGWWPVRTARLDGTSRVRFRVRLRRRVPARVVLTLADGATVLAASPSLLSRPRPGGSAEAHRHPRDR